MASNASPMTGRSTAEAVERLARFGPNALPEQAAESLWKRFARQFVSTSLD
jgi:P-type Ca2+ transporter type 2C